MAPETLGLIPARSGSQRIPGKNKRDVAGKPLVAHAIEDGRQASMIDETVVTTDSEEIRSIAKEYGANVPFLRPEKLATDTAPIASVVTHVLEYYTNHGHEFDVVCLLQPTSPLRTASDVDESIRTFAARNADSLVSVSPYHQGPRWALVENEDGYLEEKYKPPIAFTDEYIREQDLDNLWYPNGAIFIADVQHWLESARFYSTRTIAYEMDAESAFEIDEPWQLEWARAILTWKQSRPAKHEHSREG